MNFDNSQHAEVRTNQRGFKKSDISLIRDYGTPVHDGEAEVYEVLPKDVEEQISQWKKKIQRLERLKGCRAVFAGDTLVTAYRLTRCYSKASRRRSV